MDLQEPITLVGEGGSVTLSLVNLLRITFVRLQPFMLKYQEETGNSDLAGFAEWVREKLGMKGAGVLL